MAESQPASGVHLYRHGILQVGRPAKVQASQLPQDLFGTIPIAESQNHEFAQEYLTVVARKATGRLATEARRGLKLQPRADSPVSGVRCPAPSETRRTPSESSNRTSLRCPALRRKSQVTHSFSTKPCHSEEVAAAHDGESAFALTKRRSKFLSPGDLLRITRGRLSRARPLSFRLGPSASLWLKFSIGALRPRARTALRASSGRAAPG